MSDYISRKAAVKIATKYGLMNGSVRGQHTGLADCIAIEIAMLPAADVEPVVSCKGCEHAERYERTDGTAGYYCGHPQNAFVYGERWDRVFKPVKKPDDFCSFGEPKEGGNENAAD